MKCLLQFILLINGILLAHCQVLNQEEKPLSLKEELPINLAKNSDSSKINGLSFVAPPDPFPTDPMHDIVDCGANWISVIPYGYTLPLQASVRYNQASWQWWGEKPEGVLETIKLAHLHNIGVMLKPQVYLPGSWPGDMEFKTDEDWVKWETSYHNYVMPFVKMADSLNVELFCIGTEFKKSVAARSRFWEDLIKEIRAIYRGKLVYAANWNDYDQVPFWDQLDYIGINAYFPLDNGKTPSQANLLAKWKPISAEIRAFSERKQKKVLFTEYGYLSVDGCAGPTWELEKTVKSLPINHKAQCEALNAIYTSFYDQDWWAGGFLWKWFPHGEGHEGYLERDYTPQGKEAMTVLKKWFKKNAQPD